MSDPSAFDLKSFLPYMLNQAADALSLEFEQHYKAKYGMLRTEWRVLFHLGRYGDMTAREICQRGRLHKTKVSRAVAALEQKRFLTRAEVQEDRRRASLSLTTRGRSVYTDLSRAAHDFDIHVRSGLTAEEAEILDRCLARLAGL